MVDTTAARCCVWKRVELCATAHRPDSRQHWRHEETKATASQVMKYPGRLPRNYFNMDEARAVCIDFIEHGELAGDGGRRPVFSDFNFVSDLERVGLANLGPLHAVGDESLAIAESTPDHDPEIRLRRDGCSRACAHLRHDLLGDPGTAGRRAPAAGRATGPLMLVVGGYNSSNTTHLAQALRQPESPPGISKIPIAWIRRRVPLHHWPIGARRRVLEPGGWKGADHQHRGASTTQQQDQETNRAGVAAVAGRLEAELTAYSSSGATSSEIPSPDDRPHSPHSSSRCARRAGPVRMKKLFGSDAFFHGERMFAVLGNVHMVLRLPEPLPYRAFLNGLATRPFLSEHLALTMDGWKCPTAANWRS